MAEKRRKTRALLAGRREMAYLMALCVLLAIALGLILIFSGADDNARRKDYAAAWVELPRIDDAAASPPGFEAVRDDSQYVTDAYYDLLENAENSQPPAEPVACAFYDLATRPNEFRGKLVEVRGRVLDIEPHLLARSPDSPPRPASDRPIAVYQTELVVIQSGANSVVAKYFLHTPRPPEGFAPGDEAVFRGYFYARYLGKILELRQTPESEESGAEVARVIAPLIVGADLRHIDNRSAIAPKALVDLKDVVGIVDRDVAISNAALEATLRQMTAEARAEGESASATYFDMINRPEDFRGSTVRIEGEILSVEQYDSGNARFRRMMVRADYGGLFRRVFAVFLAPDAPQVRVGATARMEGVFVELLKVRGSTQAEQIVPVVVAADCAAAESARSSSVSTGFRLLIAALLAITAIAGALFVFGLLRSKRKKLI